MLFLLAGLPLLFTQGRETSDDPHPVHSAKAAQISAALQKEFLSGWGSKGLEHRLDRALLTVGVKDGGPERGYKPFDLAGEPFITRTLGDPDGLFVSVWFFSPNKEFDFRGEVVMLLCRRVYGKTKVDVVSDTDNSRRAYSEAEAYLRGSKLTICGLQETIKLRATPYVVCLNFVRGQWQQLRGPFSGPRPPDPGDAPWNETTATAPRFVRRNRAVVGNEVEMRFKVHGELDHHQEAPMLRINQIWRISGGSIRDIRSWSLDTPYHALSQLKHFREIGDKQSFRRGVRSELVSKLWNTLKFDWSATVTQDPNGDEEQEQWANKFVLESWSAVPMDSRSVRLERRRGRWVVVGFS